MGAELVIALKHPIFDHIPITVKSSVFYFLLKTLKHIPHPHDLLSSLNDPTLNPFAVVGPALFSSFHSFLKLIMCNQFL